MKSSFIFLKESPRSCFGKNDLAIQVAKLKSEGKELEAHRINQRTNFDLEMINEVGYVNGIENYSRYSITVVSG